MVFLGVRCGRGVAMLGEDHGETARSTEMGTGLFCEAVRDLGLGLMFKGLRGQCSNILTWWIDSP